MPQAVPTKFQRVCDAIYHMAEGVGPEGKLPTVAHLCASLGVTVVTLNTALTEMERRGVIYRRRGAGIFVSPQFAQKAIVLLCHPAFFQASSPPFWATLVDRISRQAEARQESFSLHFVSHRDDHPPLHESLWEAMRDGRVHGILGIGLTQTQTGWVEALGIPYIGYAGPGKYKVVQDQETLLRLAAGELARRGCKTVALWSFVAPYRSRKDVEEYLEWQRGAFQRVWDDFGWDASPDLLCDNIHLIENEAGLTTVSRHEQGFRTAAETFVGPNRTKPDGVIITSESVARGAMIALQNFGIVPGKDIQIATHTDADSSVLLGFEERLILVEYDPEEVVSGLFDLLETRMRGENPGRNVVHVSPRLILFPGLRPGPRGRI